MRRLFSALFASACLFAQAPAFDAASIKPNDSGTNSSSSHGTKGQLSMTNISLRRLVERAYMIPPIQLAGPDWMENVHFDIIAKYPLDTKDEDRVPMLRSLLEERFKLAVHRESKEMQGYALMVAKKGFKLTPAKVEGGQSTNSNGGRIRTLTVKQMTMPLLADMLGRTLTEAVVDRTGITGVYDFTMRFTTDDKNAGGTDEDAPSLFTAIQETLGLRLQSQKVPVQMVVVDHVERVPTEN